MVDRLVLRMSGGGIPLAAEKRFSKNICATRLTLPEENQNDNSDRCGWEKVEHFQKKKNHNQLGRKSHGLDSHTHRPCNFCYKWVRHVVCDLATTMSISVGNRTKRATLLPH